MPVHIPLSYQLTHGLPPPWSLFDYTIDTLMYTGMSIGAKYVEVKVRGAEYRAPDHESARREHQAEADVHRPQGGARSSAIRRHQ